MDSDAGHLLLRYRRARGRRSQQLLPRGWEMDLLGGRVATTSIVLEIMRVGLAGISRYHNQKVVRLADDGQQPLRIARFEEHLGSITHPDQLLDRIGRYLSPVLDVIFILPGRDAGMLE